MKVVKRTERYNARQWWYDEPHPCVQGLASGQDLDCHCRKPKSEEHGIIVDSLTIVCPGTWIVTDKNDVVISVCSEKKFKKSFRKAD